MTPSAPAVVSAPSLHHIAVHVTVKTEQTALYQLGLAGYLTERPRQGNIGSIFDSGKIKGTNTKLFPIELPDDGKPSPISWSISMSTGDIARPVIEISTPHVEAVAAVLCGLGFTEKEETPKEKTLANPKVCLRIREGKELEATRWHLGVSFLTIQDLLAFRENISSGSELGALKGLLPQKGRSSDFKLIQLPFCGGMALELMWGNGGQRAHGYQPDNSHTAPPSPWEIGGEKDRMRRRG